MFAKGGDGGIDLAHKVVKACEKESNFHVLYPDEMSIQDKIKTIAKEIYGAADVKFDASALKSIKEFEALSPEYSRYPVCMAKTQYSFSDDQTKLGAPSGFTVTIKNVKVSAGAGFVVVLTGDIMTMPGLPKIPAAEKIDVDETGRITGLF